MRAKYVQPPLGEARIARQWSAIRGRLDAPKRAGAFWARAGAGAFALALAAAIVFVATRHAHDAAAVAGAVLESGASGEGAQVTLAEGSRVVLEKDSRVKLAEIGDQSVRIELERGGVVVEAKHVPGRVLTIASAGYEVRVTGTKLVVRRLAFAIEVHVDEGEVVVKSPDASERPVRAGETWRDDRSEKANEAAPSSTASAEPPPSAIPTVVIESPMPPSESAKSLFDDAQRARREGRTAEAARLFDKLRRTYRHDPRAALAALELGRLRLDVLGDARGADEALRDAIALGPRSSLREDAEARRVQALARMGDAAGCARARDSYLSRYPSGVYRNAVSAYCGGP